MRDFDEKIIQLFWTVIGPIFVKMAKFLRVVKSTFWCFWAYVVKSTTKILNKLYKHNRVLLLKLQRIIVKVLVFFGEL